MPVPSGLASLSQTPGSNSPPGSETVFPSLDDYLREIFADLARLRDGAQHILTSVAGTDTITASCAQISTFSSGQMFAFVSAGANATTTVTLNINSLGAKNVLRPGGGAMAVGDIPASGVVFVGYNGTNFEHLNSRHASTADSATSNAVDAAYFMALLTGNPLLQFDTNDYIWYDRTNNKMGFSVGGVDRMTIDATDGPQRPNDASTSNGLVRKSQMDSAVAGVGLAGAFKNLQAGSSGTSAVISVTADALMLSNGSGVYKLVTNVTLSINLANTIGQPLALSTGSWSANTWYAIYVWNNGTNTTGTADPSSTTPTAPVGYSGGTWMRVGRIRTDSTGNKYPLAFKQIGRSVRTSVAGNVSGLPALAAGVQGNINTPTWVSVSLANYVPDTASEALLIIAGASSGTVVVAPSAAYGAYNSTTNPPPATVSIGTVSRSVTPYSMLLESAAFYYASDISAAQVFCGGWEDNI